MQNDPHPRMFSEGAVITIKPLEWRDEGAADFTLYCADTPVGRFVYGTDITGQPYHQDPHGEEDHLTESAARTAAEAAYAGLVREKVRPLIDDEPADCMSDLEPLYDVYAPPEHLSSSESYIWLDGYNAAVEKLRAELEAYREAAEYDALMEGPRFKGWNRSQLERARRLTEAARKDRTP